MSQYFDTARQNGDLGPLRAATRNVLSDTADFLNGLQTHRLGPEVETRNAVMNRQKLLTWLEVAVGRLCEALGEFRGGPAHDQLRVSICEGVDGVLLALTEAVETNDDMLLDSARQLTSNRGATMGRIRTRYLGPDVPSKAIEAANVLAITNMVEEVFFFLSKLELHANGSGGVRNVVPCRQETASRAARGAGGGLSPAMLSRFRFGLRQSPERIAGTASAGQSTSTP